MRRPASARTIPATKRAIWPNAAAPAFQPGDGSNADVLTTALGLANAGQVFANLPNATAKEQLDARHMNTALWQATWGYFLLQMLGVGATGESPLTDDDIAWARSHFIDYVRASGPLPALRIGKQPYGILPVTSLNAWKPPAGQTSQSARDVALRDFLIRLRDVWRRNYPEVPRLGRSEDIDQEKGIDKDLAEVLSMDGLSSSYSMRNLMGRHYLEHLWVFLSADFFLDVWGSRGEAPPEPEPPSEEPSRDLSPRQGSPGSGPTAARLAAQGASAWARYGGTQAKARFHRRQAGSTTRGGHTGPARCSVVANAGRDVAAAAGARRVFTARRRRSAARWCKPIKSVSLSPNYIDSLLAARDLDDDSQRNDSATAAAYAALPAAAPFDAAGIRRRRVAAADQRGLLQPALRREPELVDLPLGQLTQTVWRQMATKHHRDGRAGADASSGSTCSASRLPANPTWPGTGTETAERIPRQPGAPEIARCRQTRTVDDRHARSLFAPAGCVDHFVCDQATGRDAQGESDGRAVRRLRLGDEPEAGGRANAQSPPPPGEQDPVFQSANNPGFVHTPSLTQAATVADAAQRPSGPCRQSNAERSAGDRSVVGACAAGDVAARRRAAGPTARRAARLPVRAPLAGSRKGAVHFVLPRARAAGGAEAGATEPARINRSKPSPPTTSWTAWSCSAAGWRR